jgi:hypothetical protein
MDASKITQLLQKQNTRYINRCQTVDASLQTYRNQLSQAKYIKGTPDCENNTNYNNPSNTCCGNLNGINAYGGNGRSTTLVTGSPQQFPNPLASATGSDGVVYSSDNIMLQRAGKQQCGVPGTNPYPINSYVVLPICSDICTTSNYSSTVVNNNNNPYLPQVDTYYALKNPTCNYPVQDQNQKHYVKQCHSRFNEMKNGVSVNCTDCQQTPQTCDGCILEPDEVNNCTNPTDCLDSITNFRLITSVDPDYGFTYALEFNWDPINSGTVSLTVEFIEGETDTSYRADIISNGVGYIYTNNYNYVAILTVTKDCCPTQTSTASPCFLEGSLVTLANGTNIPIENIKVGDKILGAFGEINEVIALHRPLLGNNTMTKINEDHHTSSHHPHISYDKKFYAVKPAVAFKGTYGRSHPVIDSNGNIVERFLDGLSSERLLQMDIGTILQTINGAREVESLETYSMAENTQLYNLVVSGSHTYYVDGYAVTGWPSEKDFDYNNWVSK